ncbi:YhgE/Pip domain-containing protein [Parafrigoribacterium mesophilum]|uniref:YhgE/Pip domain-containing protein n=1 Tax=Parafrigoribacterium mesophilum TaxID=433646 RepID=UPI0031FBF144
MSTSPSATAKRRTAWRRIAVAAVILVPMAFAGLFVGALPHGDDALDAIPAAVVNQDQLIYQNAPDGTKTPVFAGRQLVTELTKAGSGFSWSVSNADDARDALRSGKVDAVLTIPRDFSKSILSLSSDAPRRADLSIRTDDAQSYLTGVVAQSVGSGMVATFGKTITERYVSGITSGVSELGGSLGTAATGAGTLADAAASLSGGLSALSGGIGSAQSGAVSFAGGVDSYTRGVDSISGGLARLHGGAAGLSGVSGGVADFTNGVSRLAQQGPAIRGALANLQAHPGDDAAIAAVSQAVQGLVGGLDLVNAGGATLRQQTAQAVSGIQGAIAQSASGAAKLSAGSAGLRSGAHSIAGGLAGVSSGAATASSGASQLAAGVGDLAAGLQSGAEKVPSGNADTAAASAKVAANPVGLTVVRDHEVSNIGQVAAIFFVPLGLWVGALAVFLVLRPLTRQAMISTAANGRLVGSGLARAAAVALAQAVLLVALLHTAVGVPWSAVGATLPFAVITALAFTAFHHLLCTAFGKAGLVVSILMLAVQVTSTGGLYPLQVLSAPFQWISPLLPLTYGVSGMQEIVAGGSAAPVLAAAAALVAFGAVSGLLSWIVVKRRRAPLLGVLPSISSPA